MIFMARGISVDCIPNMMLMSIEEENPQNIFWLFVPCL